MVDCSSQKLAALMYTEDVGKKGGNNVASLIWANLTRLGIVGTTEPFKELNIVMDNCGGQNKNRMVLRLLFYLVKLGICIDARIIFLVRGHTKNDCDRLFNIMKKLYQKSNVYTPMDLEASVQHELIDYVMVEVGTFKDWDKMENTMIDKTTDIKANHCFLVTANRDNGNTMYMESCHESGNERAKRLVLPDYRDKSTATWYAAINALNIIAVVEILDIKWRELFDKWKRYIPIDDRPKWKYYNEDPGKERQQMVKKHTKESKTTRGQRTRTTEKNDMATVTTTRKRGRPPKKAKMAAKTTGKTAGKMAAKRRKNEESDDEYQDEDDDNYGKKPRHKLGPSVDSNVQLFKEPVVSCTLLISAL